MVLLILLIVYQYDTSYIAILQYFKQSVDTDIYTRYLYQAFKLLFDIIM